MAYVCARQDAHDRPSAGELTAAEIDKLVAIIMQPRHYKIPDWFLNRQKDVRDGKFFQVHSNHLEGKIRDDLERLKKIRYVPIAG